MMTHTLTLLPNSSQRRGKKRIRKKEEKTQGQFPRFVRYVCFRETIRVRHQKKGTFKEPKHDRNPSKKIDSKEEDGKGPCFAQKNSLQSSQSAQTNVKRSAAEKTLCLFRMKQTL